MKRFLSITSNMQFSIRYSEEVAAGSSNKLQNRYSNILNVIPFWKLSHRAFMQ